MAAANSIFAWEGKDKAGRKTKGEITSSNANIAKTELRKQGITPTKVTKKSAGLSGLLNMGQKVGASDIALFTRQLATMMKAGVPLVQSFEIVADGMDNPAMRTLILKIRDDIASGNSFAHAIRANPAHFDDLFCNLIDAGEQSGSLETMLERLATYKEKTEALKAKIKSAMNYPIAVLVVASIVSGILLIKVVPQFEEIFQGFGAELPEFTQMVVNMSRWMQEWWFIVVAVIAAFVIAFKQAAKRSKAFHDALERLSLKLPVIGDILDKSCIARFARTLSTTFAAGVPLVDALESVAGAAGNIVYYDAIKSVKNDVSSGIQLNYSMKKTEAFPNMVIQMVAIGEESGALDSMLDKAATYYEEMVDNAVDGLTSLMEPIIMSFLGVVIGGLIIAMYLPIFKMGDAISGGG
ncbi:MAG: type II secretion system F family protein [Pseudomonadales bacterium]|jgi:type IV pilus assembly protein PilC|nr:type II secretion system F family protein [Pseudomonadales bacterium]MDP4640643.1 type II secretion system F family protein [Pseudomonadales bacterium]MDP4765726.1 type II secretion system F family protein [Pseudomonadales bacterium]MDP4876461.1 type II secretion system F family protein [Pseudomonadales bacterium]MDP4912410.1 type II secretion system F family protein [Pseudomonadales bacterium]